MEPARILVRDSRKHPFLHAKSPGTKGQYKHRDAFRGSLVDGGIMVSVLSNVNCDTPEPPMPEGGWDAQGKCASTISKLLKLTTKIATLPKIYYKSLVFDGVIVLGSHEGLPDPWLEIPITRHRGAMTRATTCVSKQIVI